MSGDDDLSAIGRKREARHVLRRSDAAEIASVTAEPREVERRVWRSIDERGRRRGKVRTIEKGPDAVREFDRLTRQREPPFVERLGEERTIASECPTIAATSRESNCSWMVESRKCRVHHRTSDQQLPATTMCFSAST